MKCGCALVYIIHSGKEEEGGASIITDKEKKVRMKRKRKRKRLHLTNAKIKIKCAGRDPLEDRWTRVPVVMNWEKVLSYRVKCVESPRTLSKKYAFMCNMTMHSTNFNDTVLTHVNTLPPFTA